jgi:hypothetical protein
MCAGAVVACRLSAQWGRRAALPPIPAAHRSAPPALARSYLYIAIIYNTCYTIALYYLLIFYVGCEELLEVRLCPRLPVLAQRCMNGREAWWLCPCAGSSWESGGDADAAGAGFSPLRSPTSPS